jgi:hypothetical protein
MTVMALADLLAAMGTSEALTRTSWMSASPAETVGITKDDADSAIAAAKIDGFFMISSNAHTRAINKYKQGRTGRGTETVNQHKTAPRGLSA